RAMAELAVYDNDPTLYLFTSLTAGSSHIITATSRIETILKANKIPFKGVDTATDDLARKLFQRRAQGKKLPLLVKEGYVLGDLEQIEEWNEYDELKEALGVTATPAAAPAKPAPAQAASASVPSPKTETPKDKTPLPSSEQNLAIRQMGAEAAKIAASRKPTPGHISTTNPLLAEKVNSPASVSTPRKTGSGDASGILSPRNIALPATPGAPRSPSPPLRTHRASSTSSFHGELVEEAPPEVIKRVEEEEAIPEVSSSEEEDTEDERSRKASSPAGLKSAPAVTTAARKEDVGEKVEGDDDEEDEGDTDNEESDEKAATSSGAKTTTANAEDREGLQSQVEGEKAA
ncbi:uncharacterized protein EI97DRAFT_432364, partial [Westerdykella ornata]